MSSGNVLLMTRLRQIRVVGLMDIRRTLGARRGFGLIVFALLPVALAVLRAMTLPDSLRADLGRTSTELANIFYILQLRFIVYFACAFLFVRSFRGEILQRSLHYLFLAPVRREVLAVGKYFGALGSALATLLPSTTLLAVIFYLAHGSELGLGLLFTSRGLSHLAAYLAATALACVGYGALFFLAGLFFRNPMIPAGLYLGFEVLAPFLPVTLRVLSVAQHLRAILPVKLSWGPLDMVGSPFGPFVSVLLLLVVSAAAIALAAWRADHLEITYSDG
ncbi:MAG: hypothetical protein K8R59_17950 [Thermoanaerobaculales bacterium]|nr:hypothetical protein [Thermoanaerobaculales bacterium]